MNYCFLLNAYARTIIATIIIAIAAIPVGCCHHAGAGVGVVVIGVGVVGEGEGETVVTGFVGVSVTVTVTVGVSVSVTVGVGISSGPPPPPPPGLLAPSLTSSLVIFPEIAKYENDSVSALNLANPSV